MKVLFIGLVCSLALAGHDEANVRQAGEPACTTYHPWRVKYVEVEDPPQSGNGYGYGAYGYGYGNVYGGGNRRRNSWGWGHTNYYTRYYTHISEDGTRAAIINEAYGQLIDLNSGKTLVNRQYTSELTFSPDSTRVLAQGEAKPPELIDARTGETVASFEGEPGANHARFSPAGKYLVRTNKADGALHVRDGTTAKLLYSLGNKQLIGDVDFTADGSIFVTRSQPDGSPSQLVESATGKILKTWPNSTTGSISPEGRYWANVEKGSVVVYDRKSDKTVFSIKRNTTDVYALTFSPDGTSLLMKEPRLDAPTMCYAVPSGKLKFTIEGEGKYIFSPSGKTIVGDTLLAKGKFYNAETGKPLNGAWDNLAGSTIVSPDERNVVTPYVTHPMRGPSLSRLRVSQLSSGDQALDVPLSGDTYRAHWDPQYAKNGKRIVIPDGTGRIAVISTEEEVCVPAPKAVLGEPSAKLEVPKLCEDVMDDRAWDRLVSTKPPSLSMKDAETYLLRFQKSGGFQVKDHLEILLTILSSPLPKRHPELVRGVMQSITLNHGFLALEIFEKHPDLLALCRGAGPAEACRTYFEKAELASLAQQHLDRTLELVNPMQSAIHDWELLGLFSQFYASLPTGKRDEVVAKITESLANQASDSSALHDIFHSKIYKFSKLSAEELLGKPRKDLTDLTLVRHGSELHPVILGSHTIDGDENSSTPHGFSVKNLEAIPATNGTTKQTWEMNGKVYSAEIGVEELETRYIIPKDQKSFPYEALWQDKKLVGIVVKGTNLHSPSVLDEYRDYYEGQGFTFADPREVADLTKTLKEMISSGKADYFFKEAHSDGDERNLFRADLKALDVVGTRKLADGKVEEVHLFYPEKKNKESRLISNHEFGEWIRERETASSAPLVYFNTSCWSCTKAAHELETANSPKLINIPTTTLTYTFANHPQNVEHQLLDSFRKGKDYAGIRKALEETERFKKGHDHFIFPDERLYEMKVLESIKNPIRTTITIRDAKGNKMNIDDF